MDPDQILWKATYIHHIPRPFFYVFKIFNFHEFFFVFINMESYGSKKKAVRFRSLISCKGAELGHKLLLNINRKTYMETSMTSSLWPWYYCVALKGQIQGHSGFEALYVVNEQS